jgi:hypothetical protein
VPEMEQPLDSIYEEPSDSPKAELDLVKISESKF